MKHLFYICLAATLLWPGCQSNEVAESRDVNPDAIYQTYRVDMYESGGNTEVYASYRFGGSNGTTLVLSDSSRVTFDGEKMAGLKGEFSGAYYSLDKRTLLQAGKHTFEYTDTKGKTLTNSFDFMPLKVDSLPVEAFISKGLDIKTNLKSLKNGERIIIRFTDTVRTYEFAVETLDSSGTIHIPAEFLSQVKPLKVRLNMELSNSLGLSQATAEGGRMNINYRLKERTIRLKP